MQIIHLLQTFLADRHPNYAIKSLLFKYVLLYSLIQIRCTLYLVRHE